REQAGRQQRQQPVVPGQIQALPERGSARLTIAHGGLGTGCRRTRAVGHGVRVVSPPVSSVEVLLSRIDPGVPLPSYAQPGDAGADLVTTTDVVIPPGERAVVGTGIAVALPIGYAGFVHPRSGLAARVGLSVVNTPGTIDSGYRGE